MVPHEPGEPPGSKGPKMQGPQARRIDWKGERSALRVKAILCPRRGYAKVSRRSSPGRPGRLRGSPLDSSLRALASAFRNSSPAASEVLCDSRDIQGVLGSKRPRHPDACGRTACIRSRCRNHVGRAMRHCHDAEGSSQPRSVRLSRQDGGSNRGGPLPPRNGAVYLCQGLHLVEARGTPEYAPSVTVSTMVSGSCPLA